MIRLTSLLAVFLVFSSLNAQPPQCVGPGDPQVIFDGGMGLIPQYATCATLSQSVELQACTITNIGFETNGIGSAKNLLIDITAPGDYCSIRFVNQSLLGAPGLETCGTPCDTMITWFGDAPTFLLDGTIFNSSGFNLNGTWQIDLSYYLSDLDFNGIGITFLGDCTGCGTPGCTDPQACNYDASATSDDGSCTYPEQYYNCFGCVNDADGDGICDELEVLGCTESFACNFNAAATDDDGSCLVEDVCGVCGGEGSTCAGCTEPDACNYDPAAIVDDGSCGFDGQNLTVKVITDQYPTETSWSVIDATGAVVASSSIGDYTQSFTSYTSYFCVPAGCYNFTINDSFGDGICCQYGNGSYSLTSDGELLASGGEFAASETVNICIEEPAVPGCTNVQACNYSADATIDDGSCEYESCLVCSQELTFQALDLVGGETAGYADSLGLFPGNGTVDSLQLSLDFVGVGSSWPGDMMLFIYPPNNPCYYVGGFNVSSNCVQIGDWPGSWNTTTAGNYSYTVDLQSLNVSGNGAWGFEIVNGWQNSTGASYTGDIVLYGLCPPSDNDLIGCTDVTACNYNPFAVLDDGSCYACGCTYSAACNYNPLALEDDGSCLYPVDLGACDCAGSFEDALGVCGGTCQEDLDNDGICDVNDDCVGVVDACGVCNGPGAVFACGCEDFAPDACDCFGTPCGTVTELQEVPNPFLDLPYVQGAAPFISVYEGWLDADFITIGICQAGLDLNGGGAQNNYEISIAYGDPDNLTLSSVPVQAGVTFIGEYELDLVGFTAADILGVRLLDNSGVVIDRLFVPEAPLPELSVGDIDMAPGQHRLVRQPWVLQGQMTFDEDEWIVCDENESVPFYSSWELGATIQVPLAPGSDECLDDEDGDGLCDQLELPVYCQDVNSTNYSPLQTTLICEEAETLEFWMSSFNLDANAQGSNMAAADPHDAPAISSMLASSSCGAGASQLAFCNTGQRAFVVDENNQLVRIVDFGNLNNPSLLLDSSSDGVMNIDPAEISTELGAAGVPGWGSLVPSDVIIYNTIVGPDDTTLCCSLMVAVAWIDTASLDNSGWISFHDSNGDLLGGGTDDIIQVGPSPRSLAFSQDGSWLVVACSGEGEHASVDPKGQVVCVDVAPWTQLGDLSSVTAYAFDLDHDGALGITGGASRANPSVYNGANSALAYQLEPSHVAISPDESRAYINCQVNNALVEINLNNVVAGSGVITGAYGYGTRDMSGTGFDGKNDGTANVEIGSENVQGWYQPGDIEIVSNGVTTLLLTANEGMPSKDGTGAEDVVASTSSEYPGLLIDSEYGFGATGAGGDPSYVFGARSFAVWDIGTPGTAPSLVYDSGPAIEENIATLMPDYANSTEKDYNSGDDASLSRGPQPSGIAFGDVYGKDVVIVALEQMGGSIVFNMNNWTSPSMSAAYQAYATNRDFQNSAMNQCVYNHLGAEDVYFLPAEVTGFTGITGVNEGYDAILVSNDETGSLTLFSLESSLDIPGCTDSCACNYNDNATVNDGSCDFSSCAGCVYPDARNYDPSAIIDDNSCDFSCQEDLNGDGSVNTGDLLDFLSAFGNICP